MFLIEANGVRNGLALMRSLSEDEEAKKAITQKKKKQENGGIRTRTERSWKDKEKMLDTEEEEVWELRRTREGRPEKPRGGSGDHHSAFCSVIPS